MSLSDNLVNDLVALGAGVERDAPLARRSWWRTGGPADARVTVSSVAQLAGVQAAAHARRVPVFVLGNGSNLLVSDRGVRGLVVQLQGELSATTADGDLLTAGAGTKLAVLLSRAQRDGWTGVEMLAGVPGTIGGAVRMNAGTRLGEISDRLVDVTVIHPDGRVETLPSAALHLAYRHAELPDGAIVASARLRLGGPTPEESTRMIQEHLDHRKATQPLDWPSCGSTFRNPPGGFAGRLIEGAGLKGHRIGGAQISEKHANFFLNLGDATADDLRALITHAVRTVRERAGVTLTPEVHLAGDWADDDLSAWDGVRP
jgi:UDP-N-acetylmuramate dehydrogenase